MINLLNCEASQYFTTGAFKKVKVVDDRPKLELANSVNLVQTNTIVPVVNQVVKSTNPTIINTIAVSNVTQNVLDNESFAINWLRTTYEDAPGCSFKVNDIYAEYVKYCCRNSRKNVIAAQSFSFLIKRCFPSCNLNANQTIVEGLAVKGALVLNSSELHQRQTTACGQVVSQHPQLMSPILKAHLSTPPKNNTLPAPNSPLTPHDANSTTTSTTSTLIKSLLANKLRNNQQTVTSLNPPMLSNSVKPIATQVTSQPLSNSTSTIMISNDNQNMKEQKNVLFSANPATTFSITPTIQNNFIVQNANMQQATQHLQGTQQILLVRTILGGPGQQNPVRLILPASMITQQRLSSPVVSSMNGIGTVSSMMQTISAQSPLFTVPSSQIPTSTFVVNSTQSIASSQANARNTVSTSSPLLNVLLDKGKLPDFPSPNVTGGISANPAILPQNNVSNNNNSTSVVQANQQPKMYILTTTQNKPALNCVPVNAVSSNEGTSNTTTIAGKSTTAATTPVLITTPTVNGDLKPIVANSNVLNNSLIKHALENLSSPEVTKRMKTTHLPNSISDNSVTDNGRVDDNAASSTNHVSEIKQNGTLFSNESCTNSGSDSPTINPNLTLESATQVKPIALNSAIAATNNVVVSPASAPKVEPLLEYECQWSDCQM